MCRLCPITFGRNLPFFGFRDCVDVAVRRPLRHDVAATDENLAPSADRFPFASECARNIFIAERHAACNLAKSILVHLLPLFVHQVHVEPNGITYCAIVLWLKESVAYPHLVVRFRPLGGLLRGLSGGCCHFAPPLRRANATTIKSASGRL